MLKTEIDKNYPNILKFVANEPLIEGSFEFHSASEASISPLVCQLFEYYFVEKVFISSHFILIEKKISNSWEEKEIFELKEEIIRFLKSATPLIFKKEKKEDSLEIYIESTPNPEVLKFGLDKSLSKNPIEIKSSLEAYKSPLAEALFTFPFVKEVFIYGENISITKNSTINWELISKDLKKFILDFFKKGGEAIYKQFINKKDFDLEKSSIEKEIELFLDEYINPMVAKDGGNIKVLSLDERSKTLKVLLQGACSGCPSSTNTLKEGVENALRAKFPNQVLFVEEVDSK